MKKVIINWMSSSSIQMPNHTSSTLKTHLIEKKIKAEVVYWNLKLVKLQADFLWTSPEKFIENNRISNTLLHLNYLAIQEKDENAYLYIKAYLAKIYPYNDAPDLKLL
ncbi:MAG: hypothetical protein QM751_03865 [Paludibacteraceae bacterium]